jgi:hypothetical protein
MGLKSLIDCCFYKFAIVTIFQIEIKTADIYKISKLMATYQKYSKLFKRNFAAGAELHTEKSFC